MKCTNCGKKTLFEHECKCLKKFCLNCLPYFNHDCTFDYKNKKKENLTENNPKIIAIKVNTL